jgi:uncharacterized repeat protein (TIGR01451 family)
MDPVLAGAPLTYTVTVTNNGPHDATGVVVTDDLPAGVAFASAIWPSGTCSEVGGTVTCNIGALANGASIAVSVAVNAPADAGTAVNDASVSANETDPTPGNDADSESTEVVLAPVVPALGSWGLGLLALALGAAGCVAAAFKRRLRRASA